MSTVECSGAAALHRGDQLVTVSWRWRAWPSAGFWGQGRVQVRVGLKCPCSELYLKCTLLPGKYKSHESGCCYLRLYVEERNKIVEKRPYLFHARPGHTLYCTVNLPGLLSLRSPEDTMCIAADSRASHCPSPMGGPSRTTRVLAHRFATEHYREQVVDDDRRWPSIRPPCTATRIILSPRVWRRQKHRPLGQGKTSSARATLFSQPQAR